MKRTKIIITLGPATETPEIIEKLIHAGVNVFRFNLKHNDYQWHGDKIALVREIAKKSNTEVAIFADLQGPELRIGNFPTGIEKMNLEEGQTVYLTPRNIPGEICIPFRDVNLISGIERGNKILIDDGNVELDFQSKTANYIKTIVIEGGELGPRKSVSIPDATINVPTLLEKDIKDIEFVTKNSVDFIALSFVRDEHDITTLRAAIKAHGGDQKIIAKIETLKSVNNIHEIISASDAIMVARGDLGVEIPYEKVPKIQEMIITECRKHYKPVIVATQMLMSMIKNPLPSRAEVADIAHAVIQKTDCLMLSDETTIGDHPVKAVTVMAKIARFNDSHDFGVNTSRIDFDSDTYEEMVIAASVRLSREKPNNEKSEIKGYIVFTESGKSARVLSRFRSNLPVYAFTSHHSVARRLNMSYGITPFHMKLHKNPVNNIKEALSTLKKRNLIDAGNRMIVIFGQNVGELESNNTVSIVQA
ncbi:MAG: Pyruvate kinase [Patescibacteria group bacterium]|nr:Pyruvate kinase [Patescibacteria group bacterium]